ncbi:uncharacterized protein LOC108105445 isoform X4 [Drosophila eugracilis]|uniref:uncharacterized protein LOC108105445 isoform X4 n=1 Tax=Drosophila eugracilis TaxID=29029 RepID=UPI0007E6F365|nr:uncharacterized protein LOC108105445 isoform X4 [Drosophila eugracilis]
MGPGVHKTALVAKGAALGQREDGRPLRGRQAEDQLDACAAQDRDQLLQVPWKGGPAAHLCRRRGQGQRLDLAVGRRGRGHGALESSHHPHGHHHDSADGQQQSGCCRVIGYFHHYLHPPLPEHSHSHYTTQTVLSQNADGTVSLIQVDPNNPIITLPDGTTAQVQGVATLHQGEGGATIQTVQSLTDVNGHENMTVDLTETQDGQIYITTEDGQGYPVSVSNVISVPVSMYQSVMANVQQIQTNSDGTVCLAPMQVDTNANRTTTTAAAAASSSTSLAGNGGVQCYSLISAGSAVLGRRSGAVVGQQVPPGGRYYLAATTTSSSTTSSTSFGPNNNNNNSIKMPLPMPIALATPNIPQVASTRSTRRGGTSGGGAGGGVGLMLQKRRKPNASLKSRSHMKSSETSCSSGNSSSIRCVDSASLTSAQIQLPAIKLEHLE